MYYHFGGIILNSTLLTNDATFVKVCPWSRQWCQSATVPVCNSASLQQCQSATVHACNSARLQQCTPATVHACNSARLQQCMSATVYVCNSVCLQQCISACLQFTYESLCFCLCICLYMSICLFMHVCMCVYEYMQILLGVCALYKLKQIHTYMHMLLLHHSIILLFM